MVDKVTVVGGVSHAKGQPFAYETLSLPQMFDRTVERHPDRTAVYFYDREISYKTLQDMSKRVSGALRACGVKKGDRIGIMLPNCPPYVVSFLVSCGGERSWFRSTRCIPGGSWKPF